MSALALLLAGVMIALLLAGFPMFVPLLAACLVVLATYFQGQIPPAILVQQWIGGISPAALIAVPMFLLAAEIMTRGQAADRLLELAMRLVGRRRGGLPMTTVVSCALFGAMSGSTQATVVAIGGPLRPRLIRAGYSPSFSTALIINASDVALLIPPSIGMIVYGVVSGTSIGELFLAGVGPGLLVLALLCGYCYFVSAPGGETAGTGGREAQRSPAAADAPPDTAPPGMGAPRVSASSPGLDWPTLRRALLPLGFPVIILGGIYTGLFSPTEAAAASVLYALTLELLVFRELQWGEVTEAALSTGMVTAVVFVLVGAGAAFSWLISFAQLPQELLAGIGLDASSGRATVLFVLSLSFFVGCMFVDPIVVILILTPILQPVAESAGIDPVLVGVMVTMQAAIGSATPPFGCDIFTAIAVFRQPYWQVVRGTPPFVALLLLAAVLLAVFPQISLALPDLAFPNRVAP